MARPRRTNWHDDETDESLSSTVRQVARELGVSERTVWRWVPRLRAEGPSFLRGRRCEHCGRKLPEGSTFGRRYCPGSRCRVAAHRARRRAATSEYTLARAPTLGSVDARGPV